jgi:hypothetical protein
MNIITIIKDPAVNIINLKIPDYEEILTACANTENDPLPIDYFFEGANYILNYIRKHNSAEKTVTP